MRFQVFGKPRVQGLGLRLQNIELNVLGVSVKGLELVMMGNDLGE